MRPPSFERALSTMLGELYASDVTQVQWNVYDSSKNVRNPTKVMANFRLMVVWLSSFLARRPVDDSELDDCDEW